MIEFAAHLRSVLAQHGVRVHPPLNADEIAQQLAALHVESAVLAEFYGITNGVEKDWFRIFPLEDLRNVKGTWDSLLRVNGTKTPYLRDHPELLERFLVVASISGGNCAVLDRTDGRLWYQDEELHQTDLDLLEFIRVELREVDELC